MKHQPQRQGVDPATKPAGLKSDSVCWFVAFVTKPELLNLCNLRLRWLLLHQRRCSSASSQLCSGFALRRLVSVPCTATGPILHCPHVFLSFLWDFSGRTTTTGDRLWPVCCSPSLSRKSECSHPHLLFLHPNKQALIETSGVKYQSSKPGDRWFEPLR